MTVLDNLYKDDEEVSIDLTTLEKALMKKLSSEERVSIIIEEATNIISKYGSEYEGTPEYSDVIASTVCSYYEEMIKE